MTQGHVHDGRLPTWDGVDHEGEWDALLIGNGLSRSVWPEFDYPSLYRRAVAARKLTRADQAIFAALGHSTNFERVLSDLLTAQAIATALDRSAAPFSLHYASIRMALPAAIRASHVDMGDVPAASLQAIHDGLRMHRSVFTTNYDLLAYWAMGCSEFKGFWDGFWGEGGTFDEGWEETPERCTAVHFLHGALHLVVEEDGRTRKRRNDGRTLLAQFDRPSARGPLTRPLLVTEGSSQEKLAAIEDNGYLAHALHALKTTTADLVVFGHGLGEQDQHLVDAINRHPERAVAVSLLPGTRDEVRRAKHVVASRLVTERLCFFEAGSHPLGAAGVTADDALAA